MPFQPPTPEKLKDFSYSPDAPTDSPDLNKAMDALYSTESNDKQMDDEGNPIESPAGAIGAAQIMPSTGPEAAKLAGLDWDENRFRSDKDYNKQLGKAYFKNQLDKFGDLDKAYAAYNAGPTALKRALAKAEETGGDWKEHLPAETQDYIEKNLQKVKGGNVNRTPSSKFAPPTPEKLKAFEAAKAKENENKDPGFFDKVSQDGEDLVKALGQGATLGGGDEILGALQASGDVLTGDTKLADWVKKYREHQKQNEADYDEVKKRSPVLSLGGELAGGFLLPVGSAMNVAKGLGTAGKLALGAGIGGTAGALSSHGDLDDGHRGELAKDATLGAGLGVGAELGGQALSKAGGYIGKEFLSPYIQDSPKLRQILKSFQVGTEGKGFTGNANKERLQQELESNASGLGEDLNKMKDYGQEQYKKVLGYGPDGQLLPDAPSVTVSKNEDLKSIEDAVSSLENAKGIAGPRNQEALDVLTKMKNGEAIPAAELKELQKYLRDNAQKINQGTTAGELSSASETANKLLKEQVPGYSKVNELHGQIQDPINSFIKNVPSEEMNIASRPKGATIDTSTYKSAEDVIRKSELPYGQGDKQSNQLRLLKEGLQNLQKSDPEALKRMGIDNIDQYFKKLQGQSDIQAISRGISKSGEMNKNILDTFSPDLNTAYKGANIAGQSIGLIGKVLYKMPNEALSPIAQTLKESPGTSFLGKALEEALQNPNSAAKNAVLFSIMQNPDARKQLQNVIPTGETKE